jgi:hypothetical protein
MGRMKTLAICVALLLGAALPGVAAGAGPPQGEARIWIYRIYEPAAPSQTPYVRFNGAVVAAAPRNGAFYRDVPPGSYRITVDSDGAAPDQFVRVLLPAGASAFVKVAADNWWASANCETAVATFYTLVVDPPLAQAEMASLEVK